MWHGQERQLSNGVDPQGGQPHGAQSVVAADPPQFAGSPQVAKIVHGQVWINVMESTTPSVAAYSKSNAIMYRRSTRPSKSTWSYPRLPYSDSLYIA